MPKISCEEIPRRIKPIIYAIDTSGSMAGEKISAVVESMHECKQFLTKQISADLEIMIGVLTFSNGVRWITDNWLVSPQEFLINELQPTGLTELGAAIHELGRRINKDDVTVRGVNTFFYLPSIIFICDGAPTDNWRLALETANNNIWFRGASKMAITIGDDVDDSVFCEFERCTVHHVNSINELKQIIVAASNSASKTTLYLDDVFSNTFLEENYIQSAGINLEDLVDVDPIEKEYQYQIVLYGSPISIADNLSITRCQVSPCELVEAKNEVFLLRKHDKEIEIVNKGFKCYAEFCIEPSIDRMFNNFLNKNLQFIFNDKEAKNIEVYTDTESSVIFIKNNCEGDIFVKVEFLPGTTMDFIDNDRLTDESGRKILGITKMYCEDITSSIGAQNPEEALMGDIEWDDEW